MTFNSYGSYQKSTADLLGDVPSHWRVLALRHACVSLKTGVTPSTTQPTYYENGTLPWYGPGSFGDHLLLRQPSKFLSSVAVEEGAARLFPAGCVMVITIGATVGKVGYVDHQASSNQQITALEFDRQYMIPKFAAYLLKTYEPVLRGIAPNTTLPILNNNDVGSLLFVMPPRREQQAIVRFLDQATSRIDTLIAKQQRLVELLQEKRQAVISHAVTRGLNAEAPMKDSGVEWLGEIPAHWQVRKFRHLLQYLTSGSRGWAQYYSGNGSVFVRIGNLSRSSLSLNLEDIQHVSPPMGSEGERTRICTDDLLISITAYLGSVAVAEGTVNGGYVNQHVALARLRQSEVLPRWAGYALLADSGQAQFRILGYGGTKEGLGLDDIRSLVIACPPLSEQHKTLRFLDGVEQQHEKLLGNVKLAIERLREHRSALISAAVTGKIDVRRLVDEEAA